MGRLYSPPEGPGLGLRLNRAGIPLRGAGAPSRT